MGWVQRRRLSRYSRTLWSSPPARDRARRRGAGSPPRPGSEPVVVTGHQESAGEGHESPVSMRGRARRSSPPPPPRRRCPPRGPSRPLPPGPARRAPPRPPGRTASQASSGAGAARRERGPARGVVRPSMEAPAAIARARSRAPTATRARLVATWASSRLPPRARVRAKVARASAPPWPPLSPPAPASDPVACPRQTPATRCARGACGRPARTDRRTTVSPPATLASAPPAPLVSARKTWRLAGVGASPGSARRPSPASSCPMARRVRPVT